MIVDKRNYKVRLLVIESHIRWKIEHVIAPYGNGTDGAKKYAVELAAKSYPVNKGIIVSSIRRTKEKVHDLAE